MGLPFTKMHGLGNDFVVINNLEGAFQPEVDTIQSMAHRKTGVGFDQLLLLEPSTHPQADFNYRIFNANGQEVEHCGNGARCIGLYIKHHQLHPHHSIQLNTQDSILTISVDTTNMVTVNMGQPDFAPEDITYRHRKAGAVQIMALDHYDLPFYLVSVGNPHAVILEPTIHRLNIDQLGKLFNQPAYFPKGINVSIAHIDNPSNATLHVYERGVGQTQACGTAACAVMALGHHLEKLTSSAQIHQPGGSLNISWKGHGTDIIMQGEACYVFDGQWS